MSACRGRVLAPLCALVLFTMAACGDGAGKVDNVAPVAAPDTATVAEDTALVIAAATLLANDSDGNGDALMVMAVGTPSSGTATLVEGNVTYTPAPNFHGTAIFEYTVSDGVLSDTATVTVTLTAVNDAPLAASDLVSALEETPLAIATRTLLANDSDIDGDLLSVTAVGTASSGTVALLGDVVTYTPSPNFQGAAVFEYTVSDGMLTDTATVTVNVSAAKDALMAVADLANTQEDTQLVIPVSTLLANDLNGSGNALTVVAVEAPSSGTAVLSGSSVIYTPLPDFHGTAIFEYKVQSGSRSDTATVTVTVSPVNDPPLASGDSALTAQNTPLVIAVNVLLANDIDVDGDVLNVTAVGAPNGGGTVSFMGDEVTFTPAPQFIGTALFEYTISDGTLTDSATVAVTVKASVNVALLAAGDIASTAEDTPLVIPASVLLANDTGSDADALTVIAVSSPSSGTATLAGDNVTYTPAPNFHGTAIFEYTVSDGGASDSATVVITVTPVNDAPTAVADVASTAEDAPLVIGASALLANDSDIDGNAMTVTAVQAPSSGAVALVANEVRYTPAPNFNGEATFEYTVSDGELTSTAIVTVDVRAVNDVPVALPDSASTVEDTALVIATSVLLANDSDIDDDELMVSAVGAPSNGVVVLLDDEVRYTPALNFSGTAQFEYTVSDGELTETTIVTVDVSPVNDPPVAVADFASAAGNTPLVIAASALLANDSDPDGDPLTVTAYGTPSSGTVSLAGDEAIFTAAPSFTGTATLRYTVSDGALTSTALVTITVRSTNAAPAATSDSTSTHEDTALSIDSTFLLANDTDPDGNLLLLTAVDNAIDGTVSFDGQVVTFTPDPGFRGNASFEYTVSDGAGGSATGAVTVAVQARRRALSVAAGLYHTCALLDDGTVKCWGENGRGELGLGDRRRRGAAAGEMGDALPTVNLGTGRTATALTAGYASTCALLDDASVKCWGNNQDGQLGLGDTAHRGDAPGEMGNALPAVALGAGRSATALVAGSLHTCALLDNGRVKCWGNNERGQLGLGDTQKRGHAAGGMGDALATVDLGTGRTATALAAGRYHTCALLDDATAKCWGHNGYGQLGLGDAADRGDAAGEMGDALPRVELGAGRTVRSLSTGATHACARLDDATVKCWGYNYAGELGLGDTSLRGNQPGEMGEALGRVNLGTGRTATAIASSWGQTCALLDDATMKCWGYNGYGQLGLGDAANRGDASGEMGDALPRVALGTGRTARVLALGWNHTCAILDDATLKCWGYNAGGQLGLGDTAERGSAPGQLGDALPAVDL